MLILESKEMVLYSLGKLLSLIYQIPLCSDYYTKNVMRSLNNTTIHFSYVVFKPGLEILLCLTSVLDLLSRYLSS